MRKVFLISTLLLALLVLPTNVLAADPSNLDELLPKIGSADAKERESGQNVWFKYCDSVALVEDVRLATVKKMIEKIDGAPLDAQVCFLDCFSRIGKEECIDTVAKFLTNKEQRLFGGAQIALGEITCEKAGDALIAAAAKEKDAKRLVALLQAASWQKNSKFAKPIAGYLNNSDDAVVRGAAEALGLIACPCAVDALKGKLASTKGVTQLRVGDALCRCADKLVKSGKASDAAKIFNELYKSAPCVPLKLAAYRGVLATSPNAADLIVAALVEKKADEVSVALNVMPDLGPKQIMGLLAKFDELPVSAQLSILNVVGTTGDAKVLTIARKLVAEAEDKALKMAAVRALGYSKSGDDTKLLVELWGKNDESSPVAKNALLLASGTDSDNVLVAELKAAKDATRQRDLITMFVDRGSASAAGPIGICYEW